MSNMKVIWKNSQWKITADGIDTVDNKYFIERERIVEAWTDIDPNQGAWPIHMAEKNWVDLTAFIEAWERALAIYKPVAVSRLNFTDIVRRAWKIRGKRTK